MCLKAFEGAMRLIIKLTVRYMIFLLGLDYLLYIGDANNRARVLFLMESLVVKSPNTEFVFLD